MSNNENNIYPQQQCSPVPEPEKPKKKKGKKVIIIIAVIIAALIVISLATSGSDSGGDTTDQTNSTAVEAEKSESLNGVIGDYICTVESAELCKDMEGKDAVKITYNFTNNSKDAASFDIALIDEVYQDGVELETAYLLDDDDVDYGIDVKIKPGKSKKVTKIYLLSDTTTKLEVEIEELISFDDEKLTYEIKL